MHFPFCLKNDFMPVDFFLLGGGDQDKPNQMRVFTSIVSHYTDPWFKSFCFSFHKRMDRVGGGIYKSVYS